MVKSYSCEIVTLFLSADFQPDLLNISSTSCFYFKFSVICISIHIIILLYFLLFNASSSFIAFKKFKHLVPVNAPSKRLKVIHFRTHY